MRLATSIPNVASLSAGIVPHETPIPDIIGRNAERASPSSAEFLPKAGFSPSFVTTPSRNLQIYAVTWTPTSHTKDIGTSVVSITAASYIPNSTPPIYPRSPYRMDMLASLGSFLLISCTILSVVLGVLVGWFLIPRCVSNCRTRRQQSVESAAAPTGHVALTDSDATVQVELEPLPITRKSRNYGNLSPAVSGINTSGARMRVVDSQSQTRKRSRMATENDEQDISRSTADLSPTISRVSSASRLPAYCEDDSPLRTRSKAVALSGPAMSSSPHYLFPTSSPNEAVNLKSRRQQLQTIHKIVGTLTPIIPTPSSTPTSRTRTHSLPTPSSSPPKRSPAVLDLPALASTSSSSRAQKADSQMLPIVGRSYTDPTFTRSAENVPSASPPDLSTFPHPRSGFKSTLRTPT